MAIEGMQDWIAAKEGQRAGLAEEVVELRRRLKQGETGSQSRRELLAEIKAAEAEVELIDLDLDVARADLARKIAAKADTDRAVAALLPKERAALDAYVAAVEAARARQDELLAIRSEIVSLGGMPMSTVPEALRQGLADAAQVWQMFGFWHGEPGSVNQPAVKPKRKSAVAVGAASALAALEELRAKLGG